MIIHRAVFLACLAVGLSTAAYGQETIPRIGQECPTQYAASGDTCFPLAGARYTVPKRGSRCPIGFSVSGQYCYRPYKATTRVIPKTARHCPNGYWIDGDYCQSFK
jgi:hypothetical protein